MLNAAQGIDTAPQIARLTASGVTPRDIETLAKRHKLKPICSLVLEQNAQASSLEKSQYYVAHHLHMRYQLAQLANALQQEGAEILLLKGAIQLYRPIYPRPGMRQLADLDVLVDDPKALTVFSNLGYITVDPEEAFPTSLDLDQGEHHLAPLWREKDATRVEPHVLPVPPEYAHLVAHVMSGASPAPGHPALLLPSPADQFIITLIHAMRSDRTSVHGGLFMRSFIDLELLYNT
ncbi:nucleotidyltransferase family protein [Devosia sp. MC1541]|uniref:nucleotidyltransferase family protein n=1 Tax=Devosia sp. MC1541 TaxID=2725264 RepID=UPI00145D4153|nr:nucleotidyltransferase family protein [Devosia sp. MC1541]